MGVVEMVAGEAVEAVEAGRLFLPQIRFDCGNFGMEIQPNGQGICRVARQAEG